MPVDLGLMYFVLVICMFRSCGEVWCKTHVEQGLADMLIEVETTCNGHRRMGRVRRAGVVWQVVLFTQVA